jgi:hypothetical protein
MTGIYLRDTLETREAVFVHKTGGILNGFGHDRRIGLNARICWRKADGEDREFFRHE